jgi:hypothetical protein
MSDDLIDRLQNPHFDDLQWPKRILAEAADRIEVLEKALLKIHEYPMAFDARQILLKALGEKKDD